MKNSKNKVKIKKLHYIIFLHKVQKKKSAKLFYFYIFLHVKITTKDTSSFSWLNYETENL